jgi:cellulose synthase/poly-beta-1,6-N-acetylglucosamine synthase-like glycosyltransferase
LLVAAGIIGSMAAAPYTTAVVLQVALTAVFLAAALLRLYGALRHPGDPSSAAGREDMPLPRYTVIAALYDEVEALPGLIAALAALDYPPEKLEIKLVLEADDAWTQLAAEALRGKGRFEVVLAPPGGPRTKPKALNYVLPFAAGDLVVVYDAEDRPEPDQLRRAAQAFAAGDGRLACVQARLTIDNTNDSWLTRLFTAEYAGLFDVLLPGLASLHLPIPLGGSSNHFRAAALRAAGAWDPYNVTEDADVGIRLARYGYITGIIASTTYEEAPGRLKPWLSQRTRWFKGWMQTLIVHMRDPARLWREVGPAGIAGFYLVLGGTLLAALVQPLAICWLGWVLLAGGSLVPAGSGSALAALGWVHLATLVGGYGTAAMLALMGLKRRRLLRLTWIFAALPALWLLLSVAAWRALFQLVSRPQLWEKTPHGRARTSRRSEALRA